MKWSSSSQFALFRIILGIYLTIHFIDLLPVGEELFSNKGTIHNSSILPSYGKLPIFLFHYDDPEIISIFIWSLILCSILFTVGSCRKICALWIFYGWMALLNRNPLISNPSLGYIGWILLASICIPSGERLGFLLNGPQLEEELNHKRKWEVPDTIYYGMWVIMGISYTASGIHKLQCQSWLDGTALYYVLTGPLVRQNNFIVKLLLINMSIIKLMTWTSISLEISFLFFGTFYRTRKFYWIIFMGFHFSILATVNFTDLTIGMIITHLFTFDASWFTFTKKFVEKYDLYGYELMNYDINHTDHFNTKPLITNFTDQLKDYSKYITTIENTKYSLLSWSIFATLIAIIGIIINIKYGIYESLSRFTQLGTINMYWGFGVIVLILAILMILERIFPDQELKKVDGWWQWVVIINIFQLFAVVLASLTWENWLQNTNYFTSGGFHLRNYMSPFWGGVIAYLINQWLFYHWHKARHNVYFLWILFHQFHHSPSRIETITSFYKHPLEIIIDSQIMAILLYSVLGLTSESSIWLSIFSGTGEFIYHMNIKTPKIIGYFFQRPESHRCHHRHMRRLHCPNYSDFPLWDILGGTFENPEHMDDRTGFTPEIETKRIDILLFKDVIFSNHQDILSDFKKFKKVAIRYISYALVIWGTLNSSTFIAHNTSMKEIGFVTVSSPLPLVFSAYNGIETFATAFNVTIKYENGTGANTMFGVEKYNLLKGAYNRRNIYGAIFSHGPFFDRENLIKIRQEILYYAACQPGSIIKEFQLSGKVKNVNVDILYRPQLNKKIGSLYIDCYIKM